MISCISAAASSSPAGVLVALLAALVLGIIAVWLLWYRPWAGPRTRYPVVLIHGVFGFDEIEIGSQTHQYFRGIPKYMEQLGVKVHVYGGLMTSTIPERARLLARYLNNLPAKKVNVIAHSMGGLDTRYAISKLACAGKVASLVTIGTPHSGTPIADFGDALLGKLGLLKLVMPFKDGLGAMSSLTTSALEAFNRTVPDVPQVHYASIVGAIGDPLTGANPLLAATHHQIEKTHGANDGLVPKSSQPWGQVLAEIDCDHWAQVGWSSQVDVEPLYKKILVHLRRQGF